MVKAEKEDCLRRSGERRLFLAERDLEDLVQLLADVCQVPFASLSLVKNDRLWFSTQIGQASFTTGLPDLPTIHKSLPYQELLVIENPSIHPFFQNSLATTKIENPIRFYAGIFVCSKNREVAGVLWVADRIQRNLCGNQVFAYRTLARQVINMLNLFQEKELQEKVLPDFLESRVDSFKGKSILLVEENRVHQLLTRNFLQKWGYKIHVASNGQEAVRMARTQAYDLILMDLIMPGMNGYAAAGIIRSLSLHYSRIPVLAFTASAVEQVKTKDIKAVFTNILMKPFKPEMLYNNIHKHLNAAKDGTGLNPLQAKVDGIARGDDAFKKQLIHLYLKSFREILMELNAGKMQEIDYLRHVRHKHKATFEMLGLGLFAQQLLQMQENLSMGHAGANCVKAINQLGEQIIRQLESIN